jgi:hypothetical protein
MMDALTATSVWGSRGSWWCCSASFGEHVPECPNFVPPPDRHDWQPTDITAIPAAMPSFGGKE